MLVVSSDRHNASRPRTVVAAAITTSAKVAAAPGNVVLPAGTAGLDRDCAVNVTQPLSLDKEDLEPPVGQLDVGFVRAVDDGLRLVLGLGRRR